MIHDRRFRQDPGGAPEARDAALLNAASLLITCAVRDVAGETVDAEIARVGAGFEKLSFLYRDDVSRRPVIDRFLAHPRCKEATAHLEKAVLMAPENAGALGALVNVHRLTRDPVILRGIAERIKGRRIDVGTSKERTLASYRGEVREEDRENLERTVRRLRERLEACRKKGGGTQAILAATLALRILEAAQAGLGGDVDEALRLAEEAEHRLR